MAQKHGLFILSICLFVIGGLLLLQSYFGEQTYAAGSDVSPMFYPRILLWLWVILTATMALRSLRFAPPAAGNLRWPGFVWAVVLTCGLALLVEPVGFIPICFLFCYLYPYLQGYRKQPVLIAFALLYTALIWYLFSEVLHVFLPEMHWLKEVL